MTPEIPSCGVRLKKKERTFSPSICDLLKVQPIPARFPRPSHNLDEGQHFSRTGTSCTKENPSATCDCLATSAGDLAGITGAATRRMTAPDQPTVWFAFVRGIAPLHVLVRTYIDKDEIRCNTLQPKNSINIKLNESLPL